jgi:hypothetical protein
MIVPMADSALADPQPQTFSCRQTKAENGKEREES